MIAVSSEYRRQLIAGNRKWLVKANMTLADGTPLELKNENIWEGGVTIDEAISSDSSFDIGAAVIGSVKIVIDNITGNFSQYDFYDAKITLYLGVEGDVDGSDVQRYYRKGSYVVDKPTYNGSLITLDCLDNMTWFDVPFDEITGITYPITAGNLVQAICTHVGVTLGTPSFPNYSATATTIAAKPEQKLNCREVLQYVAQMCCCYCKINTAGQLALTWYDKNEIIGITDYDGGTFSTNTTPYSDGCDLDGGYFNPWNAGDSADGGLFTDLLNHAYLSNNFQIEVSTDDIVVTGCRVRNNTAKDNAYDELWVDSTLEQTHERYVLVIDNNPLIADQTQAAAIANIVGNILAGLPIRGFSSSSLSDFSYETGDMAIVIDFRGNRYYTWITSFSFSTTTTEQFSCGVESIRKRSEQRFSGNVKTLAEANENATAILTDYDRAQAAMNELAQNALDYNKYEHTVTGTGIVTWLYNGTTVDTTTYSAERPLFPDSSNVIKITGDGIFLSHDHGETYPLGLDANSGAAILNMIFAHGINCDWIHTGTLTLGGNNNQNGWLKILDASGTQIGKWDKDGISASNGSFSGSISGSTISGTTISGSTLTSAGSSSGTYTEISGGSVYINSDGYNFLEITGGGENVTFGPHISVRGDIYVEERPTYLGWAIKDAHDAHSSDKKLKKKIKDIPIKKSRDIIRGARPRYYEFKKDLEGGVRSGFVAQELREALDKVGDTTAIERESVRREGEREVIYEDFIAHLVNVAQDLYSQVEELKEEIAELKARTK